MKPFRYKALLLDDKQTAHERAMALSKCGVDVLPATSVERALDVAFEIRSIDEFDIASRELQHDFDLAFLDYELVPEDGSLESGECNDYPIGGLTLYPLLVNSFAKTKFGECVVCAYSRVFETKLRQFAKIFELGEISRFRKSGLRRDPSVPIGVVQGQFGDFDLVPYITIRATSLLHCCPAGALQELYQTYSTEPDLDIVLDTPLSLLSEWLEADTTLRRLRPDFRNELFLGGEKSPADRAEVDEFEKWMNHVFSSRNFLITTREMYKCKTPFNVSDWCHLDDTKWDEQHPATYINGEMFNEWRMSPFLCKELKDLRKRGLERCSAAHRAFRLELPVGKYSPPQRRYDEGYAISDLKGEGVATKIDHRELEQSGRASNYVYIHRGALAELLNELVSQAGGRELTATCGTDRSGRDFILFISKSKENVCEQDLAKIQWSLRSRITDWGDLLCCSSDSAMWCITVRGYHRDMRFVERSILPPNSFALCFAIED